jgi:hypothetical protein
MAPRCKQYRRVTILRCIGRGVSMLYEIELCKYLRKFRLEIESNQFPRPDLKITCCAITILKYLARKYYLVKTILMLILNN